MTRLSSARACGEGSSAGRVAELHWPFAVGVDVAGSGADVADVAGAADAAGAAACAAAAVVDFAVAAAAWTCR